MKLYIGTDVNSSAALFQADYFLPKVPLPFSAVCTFAFLPDLIYLKASDGMFWEGERKDGVVSSL